MQQAIDHNLIDNIIYCIDSIDPMEQSNLVLCLKQLLKSTIIISQQIKKAYDLGFVDQILPKDVVCTSCALYKILNEKYHNVNAAAISYDFNYENEMIDIINQLGIDDGKIKQFVHDLITITIHADKTTPPLHKISNNRRRFYNTVSNALMNAI